MGVTQSPAPANEGQVTASPAPPISPVQARLRWMEIATRLLLLASVAIFAWSAISIFIRPVARKIMQEPRYSRTPADDDAHSQSPVDFYRADDNDDNDDNDDDLQPPRHPRQTTHGPRQNTDNDDDGKTSSKVELIAGTALKDAKLYGQPSERSAEMGEVHAGESIFVMKEATGWVLVLRGEGAMMGWMRRENLEAR